MNTEKKRRNYDILPAVLLYASPSADRLPARQQARYIIILFAFSSFSDMSVQKLKHQFLHFVLHDQKIRMVCSFDDI